jgi:hypothetical protein
MTHFFDVAFVPNLVSGNLFKLDPVAFRCVPIILLDLYFLVQNVPGSSSRLLVNP